MRLKPSPDICLLLEGTYPYVSGGVSTWVHQIITALPDLTFCVFFIGSEKADYTKFKYEPPANVLSVEEIYLHETAVRHRQKSTANPAAVHDHVRQLLAHHPTDAAAADEFAS